MQIVIFMRTFFKLIIENPNPLSSLLFLVSFNDTATTATYL